MSLLGEAPTTASVFGSAMYLQTGIILRAQHTPKFKSIASKQKSLTTKRKGIERRGKQVTNIQRPCTLAQVRNKHQRVLEFSSAKSLRFSSLSFPNP